MALNRPLALCKSGQCCEPHRGRDLRQGSRASWNPNPFCSWVGAHSVASILSPKVVRTGKEKGPDQSRAGRFGQKRYSNVAPPFSAKNQPGKPSEDTSRIPGSRTAHLFPGVQAMVRTRPLCPQLPACSGMIILPDTRWAGNGETVNHRP